MCSEKGSKKPIIQSNKRVVKTTFLDLITELADSTNDEALIVAAVKRIVDHCNVRLIRSLAPVRLAESKPPRKTKRAATSGKTEALWA